MSKCVVYAGRRMMRILMVNKFYGCNVTPVAYGVIFHVVTIQLKMKIFFAKVVLNYKHCFFILVGFIYIKL